MTDTVHSSASITARELSSWQPLRSSADNDLLPELDTIVARSCDLARNHGVAAGAIWISDAPEFKIGDKIDTDDETFTVHSEPVKNIHKLIWSCDLCT